MRDGRQGSPAFTRGGPGQAWPDGRPMLHEEDIKIIQSMGEVCPETERILLTGEISMEAVGEVAMSAFITWNDVCVDPNGKHYNDALFAGTHFGTIRMRRFASVAGYPYRLLNEIRAQDLMEQEAHRLGLHHWLHEREDFLAGLFEINDLHGKYTILDNYQETMYLNAVTVFCKPWFNEIPPRVFFSAPFTFEGIKLIELSEEQKKEAGRVARWDLNYLVNAELQFLHNLVTKK